jgi:hypothetical protein
MELNSTGSLSRSLGVPTTTFLGWLKVGMPDGSARVAGRRVFTPDDVAAVCRWLDAHGKQYRKNHEPTAV